MLEQRSSVKLLFFPGYPKFKFITSIIISRTKNKLLIIVKSSIKSYLTLGSVIGCQIIFTTLTRKITNLPLKATIPIFTQINYFKLSYAQTSQNYNYTS